MNSTKMYQTHMWHLLCYKVIGENPVLLFSYQYKKAYCIRKVTPRHTKWTTSQPPYTPKLVFHVYGTVSRLTVLVTDLLTYA